MANEVNTAHSFDNIVNADFHRSEYDTRLTVAQTLVGGAAATVVDAAASMWNSLPGTPEVETADLLKRISNDALQVYNEHTEAVQLASFVAGSLIPFGLATKGMAAARSGVKGINWFSKAGKEADLASVNKLFSEAGGATLEYRNLIRSTYAKGAANQALDAVAGEVAVVALMNQHPLMEDYMKDPVKDFAISAGLGAVVGGAIGHIADRYMLRQLTGSTEAAAIKSTIGTMRDIAPDMSAGVALQSHEVNIKNLGNIIRMGKDANKDATNDLGMMYAEKILLTTKEQQVQLFESIISPIIKALPRTEKDAFMRLIIDKPEMFGVEKVSFFSDSLAKKASKITDPKEMLQYKPSLTKDVEVGMDLVTKEVESVFYPEFNKFGITSDITSYGNAATLGKTGPQLVKELPFNHGKTPNLDSSLELISKSTAQIDASYSANKLWITSFDEAKLSNLTIGTEDLPLLTAVITKIKEDPNMMANLQVKLADRSPVFETILSAQGKKVATNVHGLPLDYAREVEKFTSPTAIARFDPTHTLADKQAAMAINGWLGGDQAKLSKMALAYSAKGYTASSLEPADKILAAQFSNIFHSPPSIALRAKFMKLADADGNVLLYRGSRAKDIKQQNILESYSTDPKKAGEFGTVRLYKVHVDNIVAGWADLPSKDSIARNEILVLPGARIPEATLDQSLQATFIREQEAGKVLITDKNSKQYSFDALQTVFIEAKENQIDSMLLQGLPLETIALKTNTPLDVVGAYAMDKEGGLASLIQRDIGDLIITKTTDIAKDRLKATNSPIILEGNVKKNPYTEAHANLTNKQMSQMSDIITMATMYGSNNAAVRELGRYLNEDLKIPMDILKLELSKVNNEFAGNAFINSTDFWARNMGSVGPIVSSIGKQVQRISNDFIKRVVTPISGSMATVAKDAVSTVEFNTFVNVNAGLKGWRGFDETTGNILQRVEKVDEAGKIVTVLEPVKYQGTDYIVQTDSVRSLIKDMQAQSTELLSLANTIRKIKGQPDVTDIGLWIPSFNPVNKFIAYVHNSLDDTTKMIWTNGKEEFSDAVLAYKKFIKESGQSENVRIITKEEQKEWNVLNGRLDTMSMERADVAMQKSGSATQAITRSTLDVFSEIAGGYEHYVTGQMRNLAELNMHEVAGQLDRMSVINQAITGSQPLSEIKKILTNPKDAAAVLKNTLLGSPNLGEYAGWQKVNSSFETGLAFALNGVTSIWDGLTKPLIRGLGKDKGLTPEAAKKIDYEQMQFALKERGIVNPWAVFDEEAAKMFGLSKLADHKDSSKRLIYASNALAATVALRIGELAQPLVNILSLPILTGLATASKMPKEFMGVQRGTAELGTFGGVQIMYEGARAANSPLWKKFDRLWETQGHYTSLVSEASNVLRMSRSFEKGAISTIENALDSNMVNIMSKPADWSEAFVRRQTMFTGAVLAKRLYPELSDQGITIFARDFMDKAVGNFHASQRPVFFQGTLGVALGLFQTYMLTLGQSVYRQLEMRNYKALGKAALSQSTIFGVGSMPGFKEVSTLIGDHFSDENVDLTTGTYRAIGNPAASLLLYGLPSNMGPSLYSRGDISIRPPNVLAGLQNTVAVSFVSQTMDMFSQLKRATENDNPNMARALGEALSMQSMSRPIARGSELLTGYSITRKGNTVQTPEEVWTATGVMARVLGTRPIEETKLREAMHLNTFYGSKDRERRQEVTIKLKTAIRGGELSSEQIENFASKYLRFGGTPTGWRSALNTAIAQTDINGDITLVDKLKPNSPLLYMIDNLD